jgi:hypothetical protein
MFAQFPRRAAISHGPRRTTPAMLDQKATCRLCLHFASVQHDRLGHPPAAMQRGTQRLPGATTHV